MTAWLSPSRASDRVNSEPEPDGVVIFAALMLLLAIVLYLVAGPEQMISVNDVTSLTGP